MSQFAQVLTALREQMTATLSRSDVLRPLAWIVGLLLLALVGMTATKADYVVQITILVLAVLSAVIYLAAYIFCLAVDRDALRSEKYSLHKMALEQGLIGDSNVGVIEAEDLESESKNSLNAKQIEHKE